jgi:hypothetical protein
MSAEGYMEKLVGVRRLKIEARNLKQEDWKLIAGTCSLKLGVGSNKFKA